MDDLAFSFCLFFVFLSVFPRRVMRNPAAACVVRGRFVLTQNVAPPFSFFFFFFVDVEHPLFPLSSQPQRTDEAIAAAAAGGAAAAAGGAAVVVERAKLSQQIKERHLKQRVTQTNLQIFPVSIC